jgi:hypothetical protein
MSAGDFMFVLPFLPHLEANMSTTEELWWLACRPPGEHRGDRGRKSRQPQPPSGGRNKNPSVSHYVVDKKEHREYKSLILRLGLMEMIHHVWRLSENREDNLGLAFTTEGLILGRTPLIERRDANFVVRGRSEIERLLSRAYRMDLAVDRIMSGLATVASALNADDPCLARIAAVHLRIPDLPNRAARDGLEEKDILVESADWNPAQHPREIRKASPDDPKRPGWPAGTEGGLGGKFRPKDGSQAVITQEVQNRILRIAMRRALRTTAVAILHIGGEAAANFIPGVNVVADVAMLVDIVQTIYEFKKLAIDAAAAIDFAKKGARSLEDLQVSSSSYEEFSSYDQFIKGELSLDQMAKWFGGAGDGNQYHHIVTQGGANAINIPPELLQNTDNVICLPTLLHEAVSAEYLRRKEDTNMTMYQWLQTQPFDVQREEGLKILRNLHILK